MEYHEYANIFPMQSEEEIKELSNDIKFNGLNHKILLFEGKILDGRNRHKACRLANINPDFIEFKGNKKQALDLVWSENFHRRHLTSSQKAAVAVEMEGLVEILRKEAKERQVRKPVEKNSVVQRIAQQKSKQEIEQAKTRTRLADKAGTNRQYIQDVQKIREEAPEAFEEIKEGKKTIPEVKKEIKKAEKIKKYKELSNDFKSDEIKIFHADFREYSKKIEDNSIDLILTDPPYPKEHLELWKDLFDIGHRILKENSFLVAYTGQLYLDEIFKFINQSQLNYYWLSSIEFTKKPLVHARNVINEFKPIIILQKGIKKNERTFSDKISMKYTERELHDKGWGQTVEPFEMLIENFSNPNDIIFDPFAGTGTTLIASKRKKRRCIGCEIDKNNIEITKGRLSNE